MAVRKPVLAVGKWNPDAKRSKYIAKIVKGLVQFMKLADVFSNRFQSSSYKKRRNMVNFVGMRKEGQLVLCQLYYTRK